jgi:hypothetical protein
MRAIVTILLLLASAAPAAAQSAKDFTDGIGYYLVQGGKYQLLIWMQPLGAPFVTALAENPAQAATLGTAVKRDARFVTFGIDFSRALGIVPPHFALGFCVFTPGPDRKTTEQIVQRRIPFARENHQRPLRPVRVAGRPASDLRIGAAGLHPRPEFRQGQPAAVVDQHAEQLRARLAVSV